MVDAAAYLLGRRCVCTHQVAALFCVKCRHGHQLKSDAKSIIRSRLLEEQSCQISSRSDLKQWSLNLLLRCRHNKKKNKNKMNNDMRSVPRLKIKAAPFYGPQATNEQEILVDDNADVSSRIHTIHARTSTSAFNASLAYFSFTTGITLLSR